MAGPPIQLTLDSLEVTPGDVLRGRVEVMAALPTAVSLELVFAGVGRESAKRELTRLTLATGGLEAGARFPFEVSVPGDLSPTYVGKHVSVEWELMATVDVPWAFDPTIRRPITVLPRVVDAAGREALLERPTGPSPPSLSDLTSAVKVPAAVGVAIVLLCVLPLLVSVLPLLLLLAPSFLIMLIKAGFIRSRLREFTVKAPAQALVGDVLPVEVSFQLVRPIEVESITVSLICKEHWTTGSKKKRTHHHATVHTQTEKLLGAYVLAPERAGAPATVRGFVHVTLPPTGPSTSGAVLWQVEARAYLVGWPDPIESQKIDVLGARGGAEHPRDPEGTERASSGVVFLQKGKLPPRGLDVSTAGASMWGWLALTILGPLLVGLDRVLPFAQHVHRAYQLDLITTWPQQGPLAAVGLVVFLIGGGMLAYRIVR